MENRYSIRDINLVAAVWCRGGLHFPAIQCRTRSNAVLFTGIKTPRKPWRLPIGAAQRAQIDLLKATADHGIPETKLDAFFLLFKIGYKEPRELWSKDVIPAELVLRRAAEDDRFLASARPPLDESIKSGDPPIFRETHERLMREGYSSEEAVNMITRVVVVETFGRAGQEVDYDLIEDSLARLPDFPDNMSHFDPSIADLPAVFQESDADKVKLIGAPLDKSEREVAGIVVSSCPAYMMQIDRRKKEGIPDDAVVPLNAFEQLVLEALEELPGLQFRQAGPITTMARLISAQPISENSVLETLNSLEARYVVFTWSHQESLAYEDKQYFKMTKCGEQSLENAQVGRRSE